MASLAKVKIRAGWNHSGDRLEFECRARVTDKGVFILTVPPNVATAYSNVNAGSFAPMEHPGAKCEEGAMEVKATTLDAAIATVQKVADAVVAGIKYDERLVIRYLFKSGCCYFVTPDGVVSPSSTGGNCRLVQPTQRFDDTPWTVTLRACVYVLKETTKPLTGERIAKHVWPDADWELGEFGTKLNKFGAGTVDQTCPYGTAMLQDSCEIPYTEHAAEFLYKSLLGMCILSERLDKTFGKTAGDFSKMLEEHKSLGIAELYPKTEEV